MNKTIGTAILIILFLMFFPRVALGQAGSARGKLVSVVLTADTPIPPGLYCYEVTLEQRGETITLSLWMTPDAADGLAFHIGRDMKIMWAWDGNGHKMYKGAILIDEYLTPKTESQIKTQF